MNVWLALSHSYLFCLELFVSRNVLQKACELNISTIALCVINSVRRNFPPDEGAHIALRKYLSRNCLSLLFKNILGHW